MNVTDRTNNLTERIRILELKLGELQLQRESVAAAGPESGPPQVRNQKRRVENDLFKIQGEELSVQREELSVQSEELKVQSEALDSSRVTVELERQRYRDLFDFAPDGYLVTDADGMIREANRAAAVMLGRQPELLAGKPIAVFLGQEERRAFRSSLIGLHAGDAGGELEVDLYPTGGPAFRASLTVAAMRDPEGKTVGLRWLLRDITARHLAEREAQRLNRHLEARVAERTQALEMANVRKDEALAAERRARSDAELAGRRLRDLVDGLGAIVWEAEADTFRYSYVSEHAAPMLGYPVAEWSEEGFAGRLIHPDDLDSVISLRRQAIERRRDDDIEYRVLAADGRIFRVRELFHVVVDERGDLKGIRGVIVDVNNQHEAAQALRDNELRLRRLVDSNILGVAFCDSEGTLIGANGAFLEMVAYSQDQLTSGELKWAGLTPAEYIPVERRAVAQARSNGVFTPFEKEFIRSDGSRVPVLVGGAYLDDMAQEFVCFALDLTEQKRVLEELHVRDRAIAAAANGVIIADASPMMRIIYANPATESITGYAVEELVGQGPGLLQGPGTDPAAVNEIQMAVTRHRSCRVTLLNYRKDGTPFWSDLTIAPVRNPGGRVSHYIGIMQDVTQQQEAEQEISRLNGHLRERVAEFTTLLDVIPIGIVIARDPDCREMVLNPAMADILSRLGYGTWPGSAAEGTGSEHPPVDLPIMRAITERRTVRDVDFEVTSRGRRHSLAGYAAPLFGSAGDVRGAIGAFVDISEIKQAEEESRTMRIAAETANRAKDRFMAILSHELRTPMAPVIFASYLLSERADLPDDIYPLVDIIRRNVDLEVRLIDDLLDLTGIENGKMTLRIERVDLHTLLPDVVEMFREPVVEKKLHVAIEPLAACHVVHGDASRLRQIFWNLLKNGVKFTPSGGSIAIRTRNEEAGRIVVEMEDTGIGVEPELLRHLFDPFVQGERLSEGEGFAGLGLGLAICRALVELHGGVVVVRSGGLNQGSIFTVVLDCLPTGNVADAVPAPPEQDGTLRSGFGILLVDDHSDTRRVLKLLLNKAGHRVILAGSVSEGVAAARGGGDVDLVISDIGLPDGTGHELLRMLNAERSVPMPAIALSGFGMESDIRQSLEAGFAIHLTKPVSFQQIQQAIDRIMERQEES